MLINLLRKASTAASMAMLYALLCLFSVNSAHAEGLKSAPILPLGDLSKAAPGSWTGVYVGAGGGYQVGDTGLTLDCGECGAVNPFNLLTADGLSGRGWAFDARIGLDFQVPNTMIVVGVLGGHNWGDIGSSTPPDGSYDYAVSGTIEQTWYAGGRIGLALPTKTLAYVGYAWTQADLKASLTMGDSVTSASRTIDGKMFLAGLEQMINQNWSLGAEYTLSDFDDACLDLDGHSINVAPDVHAFKVRLNFRPFAK